MDSVRPVESQSITDIQNKRQKQDQAIFRMVTEREPIKTAEILAANRNPAGVVEPVLQVWQRIFVRK